MPQSYRKITSETARRIRLVVTDIDGTITSTDGSLSSVATEAIRSLEEQTIPVGFATGRTLPRLELLARDLGITGPIIAENGGVVRLKVGDGLADLGYSRQPAIRALAKLKETFHDAIEELDDNRHRLTDVTIQVHGIEIAALRKYLDDTYIVNSGYMLHILPRGVSKGETLGRLLGQLYGGLSPEEVMVFGDSPTDISLLDLFPHSIAIPNPRLPSEERQSLGKAAKYVSDLPEGDGFAEVISHLLKLREPIP